MKRWLCCWCLAFLLVLCMTGPLSSAYAQNRATVGAAGGLMRFTADEDMSTDAQMRPIGNLVFQYVSAFGLDAVLDAGFGWNAYKDNPDTLTTVWPFTLGLQYRFGGGSLVPRLGFGGGLYVISVLRNRQVSLDPISRARMRTTHPGIYGALGIEKFRTEKMSYTFEVLGHYIFSEDLEKFKSGFAQNDQFFEVRAGIHYYFEPGLINR